MIDGLNPLATIEDNTPATKASFKIIDLDDSFTIDETELKEYMTERFGAENATDENV